MFVLRGTVAPRDARARRGGRMHSVRVSRSQSVHPSGSWRVPCWETWRITEPLLMPVSLQSFVDPGSNHGYLHSSLSSLCPVSCLPACPPRPSLSCLGHNLFAISVLSAD